MTLWDGLLDFTFDVYRRDRDGLLATRGSQLTNTFGASLPEENLNADRTEGIEFTLEHRNKIGQVSYGVQGNFNFARSKMTRQIHGEYESSWDVSAGDIQQLGNSRTMIRFIMHLCKAVIEVIP